MTPEQAAAVTNDLRTVPFFLPFEDSTLHATNAISQMSYAQRARLLADAIPALSFAVGANPVDRWDNNDLASDDVETWFKDPKIINILDSEKEREWSHTFFLKVPYMVVHKLFEDIVGKIEQGENQ
ncbi:MAG: hypothetical protein IJI36_09155 [Kiritimatiellae bacterium]|nr:hypothetical protein [Kiritimatiellia bacterium]